MTFGFKEFVASSVADELNHYIPRFSRRHAIRRVGATDEAVRCFGLPSLWQRSISLREMLEPTAFAISITIVSVFSPLDSATQDNRRQFRRLYCSKRSCLDSALISSVSRSVTLVLSEAFSFSSALRWLISYVY